MVNDIRISIADAVSEDDLAQLGSLLPQLSSSATFDADRVRGLTAARDCDLFVARIPGRIVGMATLVSLPLVTGRRGIVEDVVVDQEVRGRGVARLLLEAIVGEASRRRLDTLDLTSRPSRVSALRLYESLGFERRETNVLRLIPPATE